MAIKGFESEDEEPDNEDNNQKVVEDKHELDEDEGNLHKHEYGNKWR